MDRVLTVAKVIAPIFVAIFLGFYARRKKLMSPEEIKGLQQFVMKFGLPCVVFNSVLNADLGAEALRRLYVEDMPLVVIIDSEGNNLYEAGRAAYLARK